MRQCRNWASVVEEDPLSPQIVVGIVNRECERDWVYKVTHDCESEAAQQHSSEARNELQNKRRTFNLLYGGIEGG